MQRAANVYLQTKVTTTNQGDIVVMLYDGAIKFLNQAIEYLAANDMAKKGLAISKALDVINELDSALNMEKGGKLSENLHSLYLFCSNHLVMANLKKDPERIRHVIKILGGLRSAYAEILTLPEAQEAAQQAAATMRATAIMPARTQAGTSGTGADALAPGAGVRQRNLYAKHAAQNSAAEAAAQPPQPQEQNAPPEEANLAPGLGASPRAEGAEQQAAARNAAAAPAGAYAAPVPPKTPEKKDDNELVSQGFAALSGFSARAGASAYQKFSNR